MLIVHQYSLLWCITVCGALHNVVHYSVWCITVCGALQRVVYYSVWCITVCGALQYVVHYSMWCITVCGALQRVVYYSVWCLTVCGALQRVVHYSVWCITVCGALQFVVHYSMWCITVCGVLQCVVHYSAWCLTVCGALQCVLHYSVWCITVCGALQCVVPYSVWYITLCGTLQCVVHYNVWCITVSGALQCLVHYSDGSSAPCLVGCDQPKLLWYRRWIRYHAHLRHVSTERLQCRVGLIRRRYVRPVHGVSLLNRVFDSYCYIRTVFGTVDTGKGWHSQIWLRAIGGSTTCRASHKMIHSLSLTTVTHICRRELPHFHYGPTSSFLLLLPPSVRDTGESGRVCKSSDCDFVKCEVCVLCGRDFYRIRTVS